jgi:tripartite-type tricarboxylate transporter receptor subunit TctC
MKPRRVPMRGRLSGISIAAGRRAGILAAATREHRMLGRFASLCLVAVSLATSPAGAEPGAAFPTRPVRFIIPFPGGGINDVLARIVGEKLQAKWGQPIVMESKTGAGGNIGADYAAQAEPDGYTLLVSAPGPLAINQSLYRQLSYRPEDFVPLTVLGAVPNLIIVRPDIGVDTVKDLIAFAKRNSGKVTYGSQGNGSTPHLTGNMFMNMTGTELIHVPYRGENLVINDMLGGHVDIFFGNIAPALPHYREGRLKVLSVSDTRRAPAMPDVPTSAEAGLPGFVSTTWFAVAGPPRMPDALAQQIAGDIIAALKLPDVQAKFRAIGCEPVGNTPAETRAFIREETARWRDVIAKNNIRVD